MIPVSFELRIVLLVLAAVVGLLWDLRKPPHRRYRAVEYSFASICGVAGAFCGYFVDLLTVNLSPEYFQIGKGIGTTVDWRIRGLIGGAQAGFVFGLLASVTLLVFNARRIPLVELIGVIHRVPIAGMFGGLLFAGFWILELHPPYWYFVTNPGIDGSRFMLVWMIHLGVYCGASVGVFRGICSMGQSGGYVDSHLKPGRRRR